MADSSVASLRAEIAKVEALLAAPSRVPGENLASDLKRVSLARRLEDLRSELAAAEPQPKNPQFAGTPDEVA